MWAFFNYINKNKFLLVFALLEVISLWLVFLNNRYQGVAFFNSSNYVAGQISSVRMSIHNYFWLGEINKQLSEQNAQLLSGRFVQKPAGNAIAFDSTKLQFGVIPAQVINFSTRRFNNYLTLNKGYADGVREGMGVLGPKGVVGIVRQTSARFSTVVSVLHSKVLISGRISGSDILGSLMWDGDNPYTAKFGYVARHTRPHEGDTLVTSGFSHMFPAGLPLGIIRKIELGDNDTYYNITVDLAADFSTLSWVYVISNPARDEIENLEQKTLDLENE